MTYPLPGIIYKTLVTFPNNDRKDKYLVVMGDCDAEYVLTALTTSKIKSPEVQACFSNQNPPCMYIKDADCPMTGHTTVLFDDLYDYRIDQIQSFIYVGQLDFKLTLSVIDCANKSEHIARWQKRALEKQILLLSRGQPATTV